MSEEIKVEEVEAVIDPLTEEPIIPAEGEIKAVETTPTPGEVDPLINQEKVQEKINKITTDKYKEKQRADDAERRLKELEDTKAAQPSKTPTLEDFDYDETKFNAAMVQHEVSKQLKDQSTQATQQAAEVKRQDVANEFFKKEAEFSSTHPDYSDAVKNLPMFQPDTLDTIYSLGPEVSLYLGKHLDIADAVASVSPIMAAVKLGQIATELKTKQPTVKPSNAPEPVTTLSGGAGINKSQEDMSMAEIMAL